MARTNKCFILFFLLFLFCSLDFQLYGSEPSNDTKSTSNDEWAEPEIEKDSAKVRDEEARRRILELETWKRKVEAKEAKEKEEASEKVKFDFSGKYKVRLNVKNNLNLDNATQYWKYDNTAYFDQRFQLKIEATYDPLSLVFLLDKGNFVFDWKEDGEGTLDRWSEFHTVNSALVRELYFQYTGDFAAKVGRQNIMLGNGGIVFEGPVDAVKFTYPLGETLFGMTSANLAYIAISGGYSNYTNFRTTGPPSGDRSSVFGIANKLDGLLLSFNLKPNKDLTIEPYVFKVFDRGDTQDPDLNLDKDFNTNTTPRDGEFEPLWVGAAVSGKKRKLSYLGDLIYAKGSYSNTRDFSAYALLFKSDYKLSPNRSIGIEFGKGSGNTAEERISGTGDINDFLGLFLCKERRKFGNIFSEDLRAGFFFAESNLSNVTFLRGMSDFELTKKINANISILKLWTTERVFKGRGPVWDWSWGRTASTEKSKDIGWEVDVNFNFTLLKRLKGFVEMGYFDPGDVYQRTDGRKADAASEFVIGTEFEF